MSHEEFQKKLAEIPTDQLIETAELIISKLCKTGGRSFTMSIPPRLDDSDIVLTEIVQRLKKNT